MKSVSTFLQSDSEPQKRVNNVVSSENMAKSTPTFIHVYIKESG